MGRRQWTLLVVDDSETQIRQFRFSKEVVRLCFAVAVLAVSAFSSLTTAIVIKRRAPQQTIQLEKKNALLKAEIKDITSQIDSLNANLSDLAQQDEQFRLVAGLEPLDHDVQRVGIGGPSAEKPVTKELRKLDKGAAALTSSAGEQVGELLRRAKLLSFSWREARDTLEGKHERMLATPSIVPTQGYFTSSFTRARYHPILNRARPHEGVDITAPIGTPIVAAAQGTVVRVGWEGDYGNMVEIDHGFGVTTRYAHASRTLVQRGQTVKRGDRIALVGETGLANGPHVHYEVLVNGKPANPKQYFMNASAIRD